MVIAEIVTPLVCLTLIGIFLSFAIILVKRFLSPSTECSIMINDEKEEKGRKWRGHF